MIFTQKLKLGEFIILAEMSTPKGVDLSSFIINTQKIKGKVDAIIVPDNDNGVMKMSSIAGGALIKNQGIDPIIHIFGRDKNRMAIQSDILGAFTLGINKFIIVNGDNFVDCNNASIVNDLKRIDISSLIQKFNTGKDLSGSNLEGIPEIMFGASLKSLDREHLDTEIENLKKQIDNGAKFITTPVVFNVEYFNDIFSKIKTLGVPIIPKVFLIKSVGVARYIMTNEPSSHLPEEVVLRLRTAKDRELEAINIMVETVSKLKKMVNGIILQTLGWEHKLPIIINKINI